MPERNQVIVVDKLIEGSTLKEVEQYFQREGEVVQVLLLQEGAIVQYKINTMVIVLSQSYLRDHSRETGLMFI